MERPVPPERSNPASQVESPLDAPAWTRSAAELDDVRDRVELRTRYGMLLQELRVLLPGVQILVAFLLTVPFAQRFDEVDEVGRVLYGVALTSSVLSVLAFTTPIAVHRFGERSARSARLVVSINAARVGIALLGIALLAAFGLIARVVFDPWPAALLVGVVLIVMGCCWIAVPQLTHPNTSADDDLMASRRGAGGNDVEGGNGG